MLKDLEVTTVSRWSPPLGWGWRAADLAWSMLCVDFLRIVVKLSLEKRCIISEDLALGSFSPPTVLPVCCPAKS